MATRSATPTALTTPSSTHPLLLPHHAEMLAKSAISQDVIEARGYWSIERKSDLKRLGFSESQLLTPTLLMPVWSVFGEKALYSHRPDNPRIRNGKPTKYEFPSGSRMTIDIHPFIHEKVRDPKVPLVITEGVKKADSAISHGLCCSAVLGVWNWRGTNEFDGMTSLPAWDSIALKDSKSHGRETIICYDSDAMSKPSVYQALMRLSEFLKSRGANVSYIYLPHGEGGRKMGMDDYFALGHTIEDLLALVTSELRSPPHQERATSVGIGNLPYRETPGGMVWLQPTRDGPIERVLANFSARIIRQVEEDDGAETTLAFEMLARCNGREKRFLIPAQNFPAMNWHLEHLGAGATVLAGNGLKDHARAAIQLLSGEPPQIRIYRHTGWREIAHNVWAYLHAGGAINPAETDTGSAPEAPDAGVAGTDPAATAVQAISVASLTTAVSQTEGVEVRFENTTVATEAKLGLSVTVQLPDVLNRFALPQPPAQEQLRDAVRASLRLLELGPGPVIFPLYAAIWRAACGLQTPDFSLHLSGPSGAFKTEVAALAQQHFGPSMHSRNLPGAWSSTENALEGLAFSVKDAVLVIDDYVPPGALREKQRWQAKADRVMRAQGNNSGRQRMRADGSLRPSKPPRCLIISTGEDTPAGYSLRGRMLVLELSDGDIKADRLTSCQKDAVEGLYARAMSGFLSWLAPRYPEERGAWRTRIERLREEVLSSNRQHRRTPEITANLAGGLIKFLHFAVQVEALSSKQANELWERGWVALLRAADQQVQHQAMSEPTRRFLELLSAAIASGKAHITNPQGEEPAEPSGWGWRLVNIGTGEHQRTEWQPQGARVGWLDNMTGALFLIPDAVYSVIARLSNESGEGFSISPRTLWKRLHERGILQSIDQARQTLTIRRKLGGATYNVLHLDAEAFMSQKPDKLDIPDFLSMDSAVEAELSLDADDPETARRVSMTTDMSGSSLTYEEPDTQNGSETGDSMHSDGCRCPECQVCRVSPATMMAGTQEPDAQPHPSESEGAQFRCPMKPGTVCVDCTPDTRCSYSHLYDKYER